MRATFTNDLPEIEVDSISDLDMDIFKQFQERSLKAAQNLSSEVVNAVRMDRRASDDFVKEFGKRTELEIDPSTISFRAMKP